MIKFIQKMNNGDGGYEINIDDFEWFWNIVELIDFEDWEYDIKFSIAYSNPDYIKVIRK